MHKSPSTSASMKEKFRLDGEVHNEGANFSAGERQLREFDMDGRMPLRALMTCVSGVDASSGAKQPSPTAGRGDELCRPRDRRPYSANHPDAIRQHNSLCCPMCPLWAPLISPAYLDCAPSPDGGVL